MLEVKWNNPISEFIQQVIEKKINIKISTSVPADKLE